MINPNPAVLFMRPYYALNALENQSSRFYTTLPKIGRSPASLRNFNICSGGNVGNFIHTEAVAQQIHFNPSSSGMLWLTKEAQKSGVQAIADKVNAEFDILVFSAANFIRTETEFTQEVEFFERLKIPYIVIGAGLQTLAEDGSLVLSQSLLRFLQLINDGAVLLGTRGDITADFLNRLGLKNAKSLGCPSFFSFSDRIMSIVPPNLSNVRKVLTAGHARTAMGPGQRFTRLHELLSTLPPNTQRNYVIQNELFWRAEEMDSELVYDPSSKRLDPSWVSRKFFKKNSGMARDYSFHFFTDTSSWRMFAGMQDLYIGDRIHGGVIALQAGRPAAVIYGDLRVRELAEKIGIPAIALDEITQKRAESLVSEAFCNSSIANMHQRYAECLRVWRHAISQCGLALAAT